MFSTLSHLFLGVFGDLASNGGFALFSAVFGAILSVIFSVLLHRSGTLEKLQQRRSGQKEERNREESEDRKEVRLQETDFQWPQRPRTGADPRGAATAESRRAGDEELPPVEVSAPPALVALRECAVRIGRQLKDLLALTFIAPWVVVFSVLLLIGLVGLEPLVRSLGFSGETAQAAVLTDGVLLTLTGAWIVTGVRTRRRTVSERVAQTAVLVGVVVGAVALEIRTANPVYGIAFLFLALWFYARMFP